MLYTNADQLANKLGELETRIKITKPHLIIVTEVNKKNTKYTSETTIFKIECYQFFHENVCGKGRGIAIYVHENIKDVLEVTPKTEFSENKILAIKSVTKLFHVIQLLSNQFILCFMINIFD